ncbi:hypothetical protein A9R00_04680 [Oleispira antarctica]|uniref:SH3b domain-containing protein n=1 Tax=Oleispira antarctica TaxID=188908 RepID=A0A1Y5HW72_OLEAN|nr:hypothetical protein A9R00_04680 [Oleispira antarctica]
MQSLRFKELRITAQGLITIYCLFFSSVVFSQQLTATLVLRIGPSVGFPYSIELPSGSEITIAQRRDNWLMVKDARGETGWALMSDIDAAGGLPERQAWRLTELKEPSNSLLSAQWFANESGQGWGGGWIYPWRDYRLSAEYEQSKSYAAQWQSLSAWLTAGKQLSSKTFFRYGLGVGYGQENEESFVLSEEGEARSAGYWGSEISVGIMPNQEFETGIRFRYLLADLQATDSSYHLSWYWSLGI